MMFRLAGLLLFLVGLAAPLGAAVPPERIVAVGDLHGDWTAWNAITRAAGLTDRSGRWKGGRTTLVQVGDIVDRGPDSLRIIKQLQRWQGESRRAGGRVIVLVGNHEAMMMTGDFRYVHPGEYAAFVDSRSDALRERAWEALLASFRKTTPAGDVAAFRRQFLAEIPLGYIELRQAWSPDGALGRWLLEQPAIVRLGDSLFVHGGISAEFASLGIEEINRQVRTALAARDTRPDAIINHPLGPLWYRGNIQRDRQPDPEQKAAAPAPATTPAPAPARLGIAEELDLVLRTLGTQRLVIGHTPSKRGIVIDQGGRLIRIDSAISSYYGGPLSWLELRGATVRTYVVPRPAAAAQ